MAWSIRGTLRQQRECRINGFPVQSSGGSLLNLITFWASAVCDDRLIQRFIITIEGHGWSDFEEIELLERPSEGEPIETKFGTLLVERVEKTPEAGKHDGKIVCRLP